MSFSGLDFLRRLLIFIGALIIFIPLYQYPTAIPYIYWGAVVVFILSGNFEEHY
jgi:hypothetical protein